MRAVQIKEFGPPNGLVVEELLDPAPGPDDVVIDVAAAGVNFPDLLVVEGTYQILPERPFTPGKEAAGRVVAVGQNVSRLSVGDRVLALVEYGAFSERLLVPAEFVVALPHGIPFLDAAGFGLVYSTAYFGLVRRAQLEAGETVLVTGASGGMGSAGVQLAKALGGRVIALVHTEQRAQAARALGPDEVLVADVATLRDDLLQLTGGHGVDVTLEMVGGDVFSQTLRATAWEGRVVIVGFASGAQNPIKPGHLLVRNISVQGLQSSDYRDRTPQLMRSSMEQMLAMLVEGTLSFRVSSIFPLEKTAEALQGLEDGTITGKAVVVNESERP